MSRIFRALANWPRAVLSITALTVGLAALSASRLDLRTAFSALLPEDDPSVVALKRTQEKMGDLSLLLVGVRSPDPAANERYAAALVEHLRGLPKNVCDIATYHLRDIQGFFRENRWLYASEQDLEAVRAKVKREIIKRKNPLFVDLSGDDDESDEKLEGRLRAENPIEARFPGGLLSGAGSNTLWVIALPPGGLMAERPGEALLQEALSFVAAHPPTAFHPQMDVAPAGPLMATIRNRQALERDLTWVALVCGVVISLSIAFYFGRVRALFLVGAPAVTATILAYGLANLAFGYLTTVTGFLVSFVMGNGTNYAIVLMAHYEEKRRAGVPVRAATIAAVEDVWRPSGVAALASAISYLSLSITSFRGFSQFGIVGAAGSLFAWVATFVTLPALLTTFDKRPLRATTDPRTSRPFVWLAHAVERRPARVLTVAGLVTLIAAIGVGHFGRDAFEYDFRKLTAKGMLDQRAQAFDQDKDALFGRWPQPTVIVTERAGDVPAVRAAIRVADEAAPGNAVVGEMVSIDDLLPGDADTQRRKLSMLGEIRKLLDELDPDQLSEADRKRLTSLRPPETLREVSWTDLPALARRPFTEADGTIGRVMLLYPPERGLSIWDGKALLRIASVIQTVTLPDGRQLETSGSAVVFAAMIRAVIQDGPLVTLASLCAVALLVLLRVRPLGDALRVLLALLVGVCWMVGTAGWLGVRITFLNFIALPFIFGVGVEYAIHVVAEQRQHGRVSRTILSAGGPVALCSWSAIAGYGSLLAARNGALQGLGAVATLGEVTCLVAAVVVLPGAFAWALRSKTD
jgi:predicted RND superfamily exporter protein